MPSNLPGPVNPIPANLAGHYLIRQGVKEIVVPSLREIQLDRWLLLCFCCCLLT